MHPTVTALNLAKMLRADPIAASQIREYIPPRELARLLGVSLDNPKWIEHNTIEGALGKFEPEEVYDYCVATTIQQTGFWSLVWSKLKERAYAFCA